MTTSEKILNGQPVLFSLTWPIFIQLLLTMLMGNADSLMLSRYSDTAVAAVGNANTIHNLMVLTFQIVAVATNIIISQYIGAKKFDELSKIYTTAFFSVTSFAIVFSGIVVIFNRHIFTFINTPEELMTDASHYITIVCAFIFVEACNLTYTAIFRSNGYMKISMYVSMLMNVLNIIGNYTVLYGGLKSLDLGVKGVAISTVVSRIIGFIIMSVLFRKYIDGKINIRFLKPFPTKIFAKILRVGLPTAGENISHNISQIAILSFLNTLGTSVVSARIYTNMLCWFSVVYSSAVSQATQIIIGHLIGAGKEDEAYKKGFKTLIPAMMAGVCIATINYLLSPYTFRIFTSDLDIINMCRQAMFVNIFLEIGRSTNLVIISCLKSSGDVKFPVFMGILSMWGIAVVFSYIFGIHFKFGLMGIWIAMTLDECIRGFFMILRWRSGKWRGKSIVS